MHLSIGQEAAAVGACWPLRPTDVITSTHRGHGHCLAKGLDPLGMFAELMGKDQGTEPRPRAARCTSPTRSSASSAPTASWPPALPIAVGAATAAQLRADGSVAVAFFGDGAPAQGAFHEALNLAAVWQLPVVFFCENNGYAEFSPASTQHAASLERRAAGLRHPLRRGRRQRRRGDGRRDGGRRPRARAPAAGPAVVEAATYRWHGHYEGDPERYRSPTRCSEWEARDPLLVHEGRLREAGVGDDEIKALESSVADELDGAVEAARRLAEPGRGHVDRLRRAGPTGARRSRRRRPTTRRCSAPWTRSAPRSRPSSPTTTGCSSPASTSAPAATSSGSRVGCASGSAIACATRRSPRRRSSGLGVGAAMAGMRPVVELMYLDFLGVCFDQLLNQAAKLPFMTGGAAEMALTVRTQFGAGRSSGSQHSQSLEALLAHIPGLTVVMPSTPADTYGLLRAAIQDPNPVVFIENRLLYGMKGPQPPADHIVPIGRSAVVRPGTDVTVVSVSRMVHEAVAAAERVADEGISVEVIDLRTVGPLDMAPILESVHKTSRLLIAHEAVVPFGIGAEIAATVAREGFWDLDAPIERVGAAATPPPYAPELERAWLPDRDDIADAIRRLVAVRQGQAAAGRGR